MHARRIDVGRRERVQVAVDNDDVRAFANFNRAADVFQSHQVCRIDGVRAQRSVEFDLLVVTELRAGQGIRVAPPHERLDRVQRVQG